MAYTSLPEIQRKLELSRALAATRSNNTASKSGSITSGLANVLNQYRSGKLAKQATEEQSANEEMRTAEMQRLRDALTGASGPQQPLGMMSFETPEVSELATNLELEKALAASKQAQTLPSMGVTPIWGQGPDGSYIPMQLSSQGGISAVNLPEGVRALPGAGLAAYDPSMIQQQGTARTGVDVQNIQATTDPTAARAGAVTAAQQAAEIAAIAPRSQAETQAAIVAAEPQRAAALAGEERRYDLVSGLINKAADATSGWTTGFFGSKLADIPGTSARDLQATVDTIKANIGSTQLQEMRNSSPTGAALGAVSDFENRMLQALLGNLENSQSPEQLKENLDLVQQQLDTIVNGRRDSFNRAYGGQPSTTPPIQQGLTPEELAEYNELMRQINGNAF